MTAFACITYVTYDSQYSAANYPGMMESYMKVYHICVISFQYYTCPIAIDSQFKEEKKNGNDAIKCAFDSRTNDIEVRMIWLMYNIALLFILYYNAEIASIIAIC